MAATENEKVFRGHAFGCQSKRFNLNGIHPNLLSNGRMPYDSNFRLQTGTNIGPGSYDLIKYGEFSKNNILQRSNSGSNWERALLTEKLAKMPHILYQETHKKKKEEV